MENDHQKPLQDELTDLLRFAKKTFAEGGLEAVVNLTKFLVDCRPISGNVAAVNKAAKIIEAQLIEMGGWHVELRPTQKGNTLLASSNKNSEGPAVLHVGHLDVVPISEGQRYDFSSNVLYGRGVSDMLGPDAFLLEICSIYQDFYRGVGKDLPGPIRVFMAPDEEISERYSIPLLIEWANCCAMALVWETGTGEGLVVERRGCVNITLEVQGQESHSGNPAAGASAIDELVNILNTINTWKRTQSCLINIGQIQGGTAPNVVAGKATCIVEVRAQSQNDLNRVIQFLAQLAHVTHRKIPGTALKVVVSNIFPPLAANEQSTQFTSVLGKAAEMIGLDLKPQCNAGGFSDANLVSYAMPKDAIIIDGFGGRGMGGNPCDHTAAENLNMEASVEYSLLALISMWLQHHYEEVKGVDVERFVVQAVESSKTHK